VALSLFVVALAVTILAALGFFRPAPGVPSLLSIPSEGPQQMLALSLISLLPFIAALFMRKQPLRSAGWNLRTLRPALQVSLALLLMAVFLRGKAGVIFDGISTEEGNLFFLALGIALAQDTIFRGYLQMRLQWWLGDYKGYFLTALLCVIWKLPLWLALPTPELLTSLGIAAAQALVLGWVMYKTGHVLPVALYHAVSEWFLLVG
jgi:membrane protease YdiL (CAAX protease family)